VLASASFFRGQGHTRRANRAADAFAAAKLSS